MNKPQKKRETGGNRVIKDVFIITITVIVTWVYTCQKNKFKLQICTIYTYVNYILKNII